MTTSADGPSSHYRFADLTLDVARRRVMRHGQPIELKALDFDLLHFLVAQAPNVVNADVLAENVWGRHFVSPENLAQRVMLLRQSLSDDATHPRYVETVRNKGYRLIPIVQTLPADEPRAAPPRHRRWLMPAAAALLLTLGVSAVAAYWLTGTAEPPPSPSSVAVLPFENLSPDPEEAYFAASMQDEVVSQLTKISALRVIPVRPGTGSGHTASELGRELNVATMLGGSVYYSEGRVRVTPRLTDAATGVSMWSDSYERERSDILEIQADIALEVARELSLELSAAERENVQRVMTANRRARDLYIRAQGRTGADDRLQAVAEIDQALELDPAFKEAWVAKSHIRLDAAAIDPKQAAEHYRLGLQAARRALDLDPGFGAAYKALGQALLAKNDWAGAAAAFRRARSLNVPSANMGSEAFLQLAAGKFGPVARDIFEEARAADPRNPLYYRFLMFVYEGLGDRERAADLYQDALEAFPPDSREIRQMQSQRMHWLISRDEIDQARAIPIADPLDAKMLASLDARDLALAHLRGALATHDPDIPNGYIDIGLWAGHFGDAALAFQAMREMANAGGGRMAYVWMPQLEAMRALPEFEAYLRDVGMVAYWQEHGWSPICEPLDGPDFKCD